MERPEQRPSVSLTEPGAFVVGCNYWASHAGTAMWSDWRPDIIEQDFRQLAQAGLQVLRVFLLWPDFQPIHQLYTGGGRPMEIRHSECPLPDDEAGRAGISSEAITRLATFADLAQRHGLKLVVGLVTGWMSGRLFVPPALEGRNVITDPLAIMWQVRLVRYVVRRFRDHPAILAWDLGNECNVMGPAPNREAAWVWTNAIANAIREQDPSRPVVSGMHGLKPNPEAAWTIQDQGELTDVLTTHPYPIFTPHCDQDPVNTMRPCLHATAESRLYADVGQRPCLAEELGTLGPMVCSEAVAADYVRTTLFSLWAHDCHGLLWWCAYDQAHLEHAPYDWHSYERELGLIRADRQAKPVLEAISAFRRWLDGLPVQALPLRLTEAVCILSAGQDQWAAAYSSFVLAKQAGFDLSFQYVNQPLKDAPLYLVPCMSGGGSFSRRFWLDLLERVRAGATLYLSHLDGMLVPFGEAFGLQVVTRERRTQETHIRMHGLRGEPAVHVPAPFRLQLQPVGARVLGEEPDGNPAWTRYDYGKGRVYFLSVPIETELARQPGAFHGPQAQPFYEIYRHIAQPLLAQRALLKDDPRLGITEHPVDVRKRVAVLINYSPEPLEARVSLGPGWRASETWYGAPPRPDASGLALSIPPNDVRVLVLQR